MAPRRHVFSSALGLIVAAAAACGPVRCAAPPGGLPADAAGVTWFGAAPDPLSARIVELTIERRGHVGDAVPTQTVYTFRRGDGDPLDRAAWTIETRIGPKALKLRGDDVLEPAGADADVRSAAQAASVELTRFLSGFRLRAGVCARDGADYTCAGAMGTGPWVLTSDESGHAVRAAYEVNDRGLKMAFVEDWTPGAVLDGRLRAQRVSRSSQPLYTLRVGRLVLDGRAVAP